MGSRLVLAEPDLTNAIAKNLKRVSMAKNRARFSMMEIEAVEEESISFCRTLFVPCERIYPQGTRAATTPSGRQISKKRAVKAM